MEFDHGGYIGGRKGILDFSSNVNPLPYPHEIKRAMIKGLSKTIRAYPDPFCSDLKKTVSRMLNVGENEILFGNGSTELIYLITRVLKPKRVLIFEPTFSEYRKASLLEGASVTTIHLDSRFYVPARKTQKVDIVFLCHPNNPTGNFVIEVKDRIFDYPSNYYVIDEAFIDFSDEKEKRSFLPLFKRDNRVIILRTLTKFFPLAGVRIGYVLAHNEIINRLKKAQPPWTVNAIAMTLAKAFLEHRDFAQKTMVLIAKERTYLRNQLLKLGFEVFPSCTNFLLIKLKEKQSSKVVREVLIEKGILVRDCSTFSGLGERFIRVCVRRRKENMKLIQALSDL